MPQDDLSYMLGFEDGLKGAEPRGHKAFVQDEARYDLGYVAATAQTDATHARLGW